MLHIPFVVSCARGNDNDFSELGKEQNLQIFPPAFLGAANATERNLRATCVGWDPEVPLRSLPALGEDLDLAVLTRYCGTIIPGWAAAIGGM